MWYSLSNRKSVARGRGGESERDGGDVSQSPDSSPLRKENPTPPPEKENPRRKIGGFFFRLVRMGKGSLSLFSPPPLPAKERSLLLCDIHVDDLIACTLSSCVRTAGQGEAKGLEEGTHSTCFPTVVSRNKNRLCSKTCGGYEILMTKVIRKNHFCISEIEQQLDQERWIPPRREFIE